MDSTFDRDTAVTAHADGSFTATLTDRWHIGPVPNGGYVMSTALRALQQAMPHPDPLTATAHFLRPAAAGPVVVDVEVVRAGRRLSTGQARLRDADGEALRVLATFGDLDATTGLERLTAVPPALPPVEQCRGGTAVLPDGVELPIGQQIDLRFPPGLPGWLHDGPSGQPELRGWFRFRDGRDADVLSLVQVVDSFPPTAFDLGATGWVPTLELTVHVRARPAPGWLRCRLVSRFVTGGLVDEDVEVWDSRDRLVAVSRQLARVRSD